MSEILRECPFCGDDYSVSICDNFKSANAESPEEPAKVYVYCANCDVRGPTVSLNAEVRNGAAIATKLWNREKGN